MIELRCKKCGKKVAEAEKGKVVWVCPRCRAYNTVDLTINAGESIHKTITV